MHRVRDGGKQVFIAKQLFSPLIKILLEKSEQSFKKTSNEPGREKMCLFRIFFLTPTGESPFCCWNNFSNRFLYLQQFKTKSDVSNNTMKGLSFISFHNIFCSHPVFSGSVG